MRKTVLHWVTNVAAWVRAVGCA